MTETKHTEIGPDRIMNLFVDAARERDALKALNAELIVRLQVAVDWLSDKGIAADHVEIVRMLAAIDAATAEAKVA